MNLKPIRGNPQAIGPSPVWPLFMCAAPACSCAIISFAMFDAGKPGPRLEGSVKQFPVDQSACVDHPDGERAGRVSRPAQWAIEMKRGPTGLASGWLVAEGLLTPGMAGQGRHPPRWREWQQGRPVSRGHAVPDGDLDGQTRKAVANPRASARAR